VHIATASAVFSQFIHLPVNWPEQSPSSSSILSCEFDGSGSVKSFLGTPAGASLHVWPVSGDNNWDLKEKKSYSTEVHNRQNLNTSTQQVTKLTCVEGEPLSDVRFETGEMKSRIRVLRSMVGVICFLTAPGGWYGGIISWSESVETV
jgi:hypothetical protein